MQALLPPNSSELERAITKLAGDVVAGDLPIKEQFNPDICHKTMLPFLAWSYSVDVWDAGWPIQIKRQVVKSAIRVHQIKGTFGAIRDALAALDMQASTTEWFDYSGTPHTFRIAVDLEGRGLSNIEIQMIRAVVENTKNVRSHLDKLTVGQLTRGRACTIGATCTHGQIIAALPYVIRNRTITSPIPGLAAALQSVTHLTVHPEG